MTTKRKTKSRILKAVHETASDLYRLGSINKRKMDKFDALCFRGMNTTNIDKQTLKHELS
jgi:putative transcriptional regulator